MTGADSTWPRSPRRTATRTSSYTAELAGRDFDAEKWNVKLLDAQNRQVYIDTGPVDGAPGQLTEGERILPIPRRREWTGLTPKQLSEAGGEQELP